MLVIRFFNFIYTRISLICTNSSSIKFHEFEKAEQLFFKFVLLYVVKHFVKIREIRVKNLRITFTL